MADQQKRPRRLWGSVKKLALKDGAIRYAAQIPKEGGGKKTIGRFDTHDEASAAIDAYMAESGIVVESKPVWGPILRHAKATVESYSTGVTLRQLFLPTGG